MPAVVWALTGELEMQTQVLILAQGALFPLGHLPNPLHRFSMASIYLIGQ